MDQIWADNDMDGADGELYVIGVCATDGWSEEADETEQIEYWKDTDFDGCEWCDLPRRHAAVLTRPDPGVRVCAGVACRVEFKCGKLYEE